MFTLLYRVLSVLDRHAYLVVFETAAAPAFVMVEELGFGAVDATGRLVVATKTMEEIENETAYNKTQNKTLSRIGCQRQERSCMKHFQTQYESCALPVVLGLAALTVSAPGLFLAAPFTVVGLVPFVAVAAATEVVLVVPTAFLSGTRVRFLTAEEAAVAPVGLLGIAPAVADFVVVVFLTAVTETLFDLTSFTVR